MIVLAQQLAPSVPTFDPVYLIITGGAMLVSWLVGAMLQRRFREYSQMPVRMTGAQVAQKMLHDSGIHDVRIISTPGQLTDHYNPLDKTVELKAGAWMANFAAQPLLWLVPGAGFLGGIMGLLFARMDKPVMAFVGSAVAELGVIGTAGVAMFPFVMPSSSDPRSSLTVWDSVSSHLTLGVMFWAALIFTPIVIAYTSWAYSKMAGKVTTAFIEANDRSAY